MLIGVPENFYDHLILKKLSNKPIVQIRLIGELLGHYPIGISDLWYAYRIQQLISDGVIQVKEAHEEPYRRKLRLP